MIVNFRQGVVSYPVGFLTRVGTPVGSRVALNIPTDKPLILHFSHRNTNYIVVQKTSVGLTPPIGAFGPHISGEDYWLYADINVNTGVVTFNRTTLAPVAQATTPSSTQTIIEDTGTELVQKAGRHWFKSAPSNPTDDLLYPPFTMFVRNSTNTAWEEKIRVFLAKYEEATHFISVSVNAANPNTAIKFTGTQAGITTQNNAGFLIYDSNGQAFKNSDGTFVTTEDVLKTGMLLGADLKVGNNVINARADAPLSSYTVVRFSDFGRVVPVNLFNLDQSFFGFVEAPAALGTQVQVILEGIVTNPLWNWSRANIPIYADNFGQLTETRPSVNDADPVAFALSETQIVLRSSRVEVGLVDHATDTIFGAVKLDAAPASVAGYLEIVYSPLVGSGPGGTLSSSTGLAVTNTFTAEVVIDGVQRNIIYGPSDMPNFPLTTVPTINDLITFLNTTLPGAGGLSGVATVSLASTTRLRITSNTVGPLSTVRLASGSATLPNLDLFENITNFSLIDAPVDGFFDSIAASGPAFAAHVADTTVHLSTDQNSLLDLLDLAPNGIIVKDAAGSMVSRSVVDAGSGKISVVNGDGVAGDITLDVDETNVDHNALMNYVGDEHVDHSTVTMTAGVGLSGGGDITTSRTFDVAALKGTAVLAFNGAGALDVPPFTEDLLIAVLGATPGDPVALSSGGPLFPGVTFTATCDAPGVVTVRAASVVSAGGAGPIGPLPPTPFFVIVFSYAAF